MLFTKHLIILDMDKIKGFISGSIYLSWILIFTNWFFQGIPLGSRVERIYKISFTVFLWIFFFVMLYFSFKVPLTDGLIVGFLMAHTLNWIINCNFFVIFIHRIKWIKISTIRLFEYLYSIQKRLENEDWILYASSSGGICKGTMNEHSDIDVSLVIKPGSKNKIRAIIFFTKEKKIADLQGIPLDIFISETPEESMDRSYKQENPVVLYDPSNIISSHYKLKMTIREAQVLNEATK